MIRVLKFVFHRALSDKTYWSLGLLSPWRNKSYLNTLQPPKNKPHIYSLVCLDGWMDGMWWDRIEEGMGWDGQMDDSLHPSRQSKILPLFKNNKYGMIFHENRLLADDSHAISCLFFFKNYERLGKICRLLQLWLVNTVDSEAAWKAVMDSSEASWSGSTVFKKRIYPHRVGATRKRYQQLTNAGQKSIETVFSIAICCQCGDKWQLKTLFLTIFIYVPRWYWRFRLPPTRCDIQAQHVKV